MVRDWLLVGQDVIIAIEDPVDLHFSSANCEVPDLAIDRTAVSLIDLQ